MTEIEKLVKTALGRAKAPSRSFRASWPALNRSAKMLEEWAGKNPTDRQGSTAAFAALQLVYGKMGCEADRYVAQIRLNEVDPSASVLDAHVRDVVDPSRKVTLFSSYSPNAEALAPAISRCIELGISERTLLPYSVALTGLFPRRSRTNVWGIYEGLDKLLAYRTHFEKTVAYIAAAAVSPTEQDRARFHLSARQSFQPVLTAARELLLRQPPLGDAEGPFGSELRDEKNIFDQIERIYRLINGPFEEENPFHPADIDGLYGALAIRRGFSWGASDATKALTELRSNTTRPDYISEGILVEAIREGFRQFCVYAGGPENLVTVPRNASLADFLQAGRDYDASRSRPVADTARV